VYKVQLFKCLLFSIFDQLSTQQPNWIYYNVKSNSFYGSKQLKQQVECWLKSPLYKTSENNETTHFPYISTEDNPISIIRRFHTNSNKLALEITHATWKNETVSYTIPQILRNNAWQEILSAWSDSEKRQSKSTKDLSYPPLIPDQSQSSDNEEDLASEGDYLLHGIFQHETKSSQIQNDDASITDSICENSDEKEVPANEPKVNKNTLNNSDKKESPANEPTVNKNTLNNSGSKKESERAFLNVANINNLKNMPNIESIESSEEENDKLPVNEDSNANSDFV